MKEVDSATDYAPVARDGRPLSSVRRATASSTPATVEVIAPSSLPSGYQFSVNVDRCGHLIVAVPEGGVKEGQQFHAIVVGNDDDVLDRIGNGHDIPMGRWRDGLFDCFDVGFCHAQFWLAIFCRPVALGQILTRMKLDWSGTPIHDKKIFLSAFKVMLIAFIIYSVMDTALDMLLYPYLTGEYEDVPSWAMPLDAAHQILKMSYGVFVLVITVRARHYIRKKYQIPEESCQGCEDCCCAFFCSVCTVCQMARHTADYQEYKASCCSETGLGPLAPEVV